MEANDKRRARLNCLRHILSKVPYEDMTPATHQDALLEAPRPGAEAMNSTSNWWWNNYPT